VARSPLRLGGDRLAPAAVGGDGVAGTVLLLRPVAADSGFRPWTSLGPRGRQRAAPALAGRRHRAPPGANPPVRRSSASSVIASSRAADPGGQLPPRAAGDRAVPQRVPLAARVRGRARPGPLLQVRRRRRPRWVRARSGSTRKTTRSVRSGYGWPVYVAGWSWSVTEIATRGSSPRLRALRDPGEVRNAIRSPSSPTHTGTLCGPPSGNSVATWA